MSNSINLAAVPDGSQQGLLGEKTEVQTRIGPVANLPSTSEKKVERFDLEDNRAVNIDSQIVVLTKEELKEYINSDKWKRIRWIIAILYLAVIGLLLVGSALLVVFSPRCPPKPKLDWYQREIIYEIDLTTFRDSNADGLGDIKGLNEQFDYLVKNRFKSILLQPSIFNSTAGTSTQLDGKTSSNKQSDLLQIDPSVGTDAELQEFQKRLNRQDMHLIIDLPISSTFDPNGLFWYGSSEPFEKKIENPCRFGENRLGCRYYHSYGRLPLDFSQVEIADEAESRLNDWFVTKKFDGVRVDLPLEISNASDGYRISERTIQSWQKLKAKIEKNSKPKLLLFDIPSGLQRSINFSLVEDNTPHPLYLSKLISSPTSKTSQIGKIKFWKLGSKRRSDDLSILNEQQLPKEMVLTLVTLLGGTPTLLYGDELGLDQKSYPLMAWTSDSPSGGFSSCLPEVCRNRSNSYQLNPMKISVKRQEALGGHSKESLLSIYRRLASLREKKSFQYGSLKTGTNEDSTLFWFVREALGHEGYVILFNLHETESAHISLHDLTENLVPVAVHYEYQWPKAHFSSANSEPIPAKNLLIDPQSINIFWWKAKLIKTNSIFGQSKN